MSVYKTIRNIDAYRRITFTFKMIPIFLLLMDLVSMLSSFVLLSLLAKQNLDLWGKDIIKTGINVNLNKI